MKVIDIYTMKGGTAKTTISVNLAVGLANKGKRVLLIDADAQGNSTTYFTKANDDYLTMMDREIQISDKKYSKNIENVVEELQRIEDVLQKVCDEKSDGKKGTYNVLMNECSIEEAICETDVKNLWLLPSLNKDLIKADSNILIDNSRRRDIILKRALKQVRKQYDYVIIDNAPTSNTITLNAMVASDLVIIPLKTGSSEIDGLKATISNIRNNIEQYEVDIDFRFLPVMMKKSNKYEEDGSPKYLVKHDKQMVQLIQRLGRERTMKTVLRYQDKKVNVSSLNKEIIINDEKDNKIRVDFEELVNEVMEVNM